MRLTVAMATYSGQRELIHEGGSNGNQILGILALHWANMLGQLPERLISVCYICFSTFNKL